MRSQEPEARSQESGASGQGFRRWDIGLVLWIILIIRPAVGWTIAGVGICYIFIKAARQNHYLSRLYLFLLL